jgi:hypothetical protein
LAVNSKRLGESMTQELFIALSGAIPPLAGRVHDRIARVIGHGSKRNRDLMPTHTISEGVIELAS